MTGYEKQMDVARAELKNFYYNSATSPLPKEEVKQFKEKEGIRFFKTDSAYKIMANLVLSNSLDTVSMPTVSGVIKTYSTYGTANFKLLGKSYSLAIYRSHQLAENLEYKDYLFLPFYDETNGVTTYKGGRYIDLKVPQETKILIDFNTAYQPYCAYTSGYACPIPPVSNRLELPIEAGVRY